MATIWVNVVPMEIDGRRPRKYVFKLQMKMKYCVYHDVCVWVMNERKSTTLQVLNLISSCSLSNSGITEPIGHTTILLMALLASHVHLVLARFPSPALFLAVRSIPWSSGVYLMQVVPGVYDTSGWKVCTEVHGKEVGKRFDLHIGWFGRLDALLVAFELITFAVLLLIVFDEFTFILWEGSINKIRKCEGWQTWTYVHPGTNGNTQHNNMTPNA